MRIIIIFIEVVVIAIMVCIPTKINGYALREADNLCMGHGGVKQLETDYNMINATCGDGFRVSFSQVQGLK